MAQKLFPLLQKAQDAGELLDTAALQTRLQAGHQTDGEDHAMIAQVLNRQLIVFNASEMCLVPEVVQPQLAPGAKTVEPLRVLFSQRRDDAGHAEGHFEALLPLGTSCSPRDFSGVQSVHWDGPRKPEDCVGAVTLQGQELCSALLQGYKAVENRHCSLEGQWVCLHVGQKRHPKPQEVLRLCPDMQVDDSRAGHICGMIHVFASLRLRDYLQQISCHCPADHAESCPCNPFVQGPILNVVDAAITFHEPFPAKGALGRWILSPESQKSVKNMLSAGKFTLKKFDRSEMPRGPHGIPPWPLHWMSAATKRHPEERRARAY